jgi:hypothetical protein
MITAEDGGFYFILKKGTKTEATVKVHTMKPPIHVCVCMYVCMYVHTYIVPLLRGFYIPDSSGLERPLILFYG